MSAPEASQTGTDALVVSFQGPCAVVTINRPAKRNAMSLALWQAVPVVLAALQRDRAFRVVLLTGAGGNFSAGADISEFGAVRATPEQPGIYEAAVDARCDAIMHFTKPTIAVIEGFCLGGGCHLAMSCDFRFAGEGARFAIPAARVGIVYGVSGTQKLLALVGLSQARRILFSGAHFATDHALRIGLVDQQCADPMEAALQFCGELAENAPLSIQGAKKVLNGLALGTGALDPWEAEAWIRLATGSDDYREGRTSFLERRAPVFRGC